MEDETPPDRSVRYEPETEVYRAAFDPESEPVSDAVVSTVSEITDAAVESIDAVVDPIVFDALVRRDRRPIQLNFVYNGHDVTVDSGGEIVVQAVQSDGGGDYATTFEADESPSAAVVRALATMQDVDPLELEELYTHIDPDALDALFDSTPPEATTDLRVSFRVDDLQVEVSGNRRVVIYTVEE